jgi:hypothetical protein
MSAMARIEHGLSRLGQLADNAGKVSLTFGGVRIHSTADAVNVRLEQTMQKIELYIRCKRKPMTLERALRRAVAAQGTRR